MGMLPSIGPFSGLQKAAESVDEGQINRVEAIINSMTTHERNHHEVINGSRRKRIARGSGTSVQEVNNLLRQYAQMKKMFKQMGKPSFARRLAGMKLRECRRDRMIASDWRHALLLRHQSGETPRGRQIPIREMGSVREIPHRSKQRAGDCAWWRNSEWIAECGGRLLHSGETSNRRRDFPGQAVGRIATGGELSPYRRPCIACNELPQDQS
jgi:hypothetical protein